MQFKRSDSDLLSQEVNQNRFRKQKRKRKVQGTMGFKAIVSQVPNRSGFRYADTDQTSSMSVTGCDKKDFWNVKQAPLSQHKAHEKDKSVKAAEKSLPELKIRSKTREPLDEQFAKLNDVQK